MEMNQERQLPKIFPDSIDPDWLRKTDRDDTDQARKESGNETQRKDGRDG
jgi:hypothetical protein